MSTASMIQDRKNYNRKRRDNEWRQSVFGTLLSGSFSYKVRTVLKQTGSDYFEANSRHSFLKKVIRIHARGEGLHDS